MAAPDELSDGALVENLDWACHAFTKLAASWLGRQGLPDVDESILRKIGLDEIPMAGLVGWVEQRDKTGFHGSVHAVAVVPDGEDLIE